MQTKVAPSGHQRGAHQSGVFYPFFRPLARTFDQPGLAAAVWAGLLGLGLHGSAWTQAPDVKAQPAEKTPPVLADPEDTKRLEAIRLRLGDWTQTSFVSSQQGLLLRGTLIPDALVFKIASTYLDFRQQGTDHQTALTRIAPSLPRWKRYRDRASFLITMRNEKYRLADKERRIFSLERNKNLNRDAITIRNDKKRNLRYRFAGRPSGLRTVRLRIKKFWVTGDGASRRSRSKDDPEGRDPASPGRKAMLSKPFTTLVLEDEIAELEVLVDKKSLLKSKAEFFRVGLHHWQRYEGPFEKDAVDLNESRPWPVLKDVQLEVRLPPSEMKVMKELRELVGEVERLVKEG